MQDNRLCQFAIPLQFFENPNIVAAAMFGMVVLQANKGSLKPGGPAAYVHYIAWHPKFPATAFNIVAMDGKTPEPPWVELIIGDPDAQSGTVTVAWRRNKAPKDDFLWSATINMDQEALLNLPGLGKVMGHG